jgi:hypothetical protein
MSTTEAPVEVIVERPWAAGRNPRIAGIAPGPQAAVFLDAVDFTALSPSDQVDVLWLVDQHTAWLVSRRSVMVHHVVTHVPDPETGEATVVEEPDADEVGLLASCLNREEASVKRDVSVARTLHRCPATREALESGVITVDHVHALSRRVEDLSDEDAVTVESAVWRWGFNRHPDQVLADASRARARLMVPARKERVVKARRDRYLVGRPLPDGMVSVWGRVPAVEWLEFQAAARDVLADWHAQYARTGVLPGGMDPDGAGLERVDAGLVDAVFALGRGILADPMVRRGSRSKVHILMPASVAWGGSDEPCEVSGHGYVPAWLGRMYARDTGVTVHRVLTDPFDGVALVAETRSYTGVPIYDPPDQGAVNETEAGGEPPGDEPPGEEPPGDEPPGDEPPGEEPPGEEPPGKEPPGDGPPGGPGGDGAAKRVSPPASSGSPCDTTSSEEVRAAHGASDGEDLAVGPSGDPGTIEPAAATPSRAATLPPALAFTQDAAGGTGRRWVRRVLPAEANRFASDPLRRYVQFRDNGCRFPGCTAAWWTCDLDHTAEWVADGGVTAEFNLASLCRKHHRKKTDGVYSYRLDPDGTCTWTSPRWATPRQTRPAAVGQTPGDG